MARTVPMQMTNAWKSQAKIGDQRPVARAVIYKQNMRSFMYDTAWRQGGTFEGVRHRAAYFQSFIFGDTAERREIRNIKSLSWERSVDQDAASCTITLLNSDLAPIGATSDDNEFDRPGAFTFNHGEVPHDAIQNPWGYSENTGWQDVFMPDMVVKTYEGYGGSSDYSAEHDPNLLQTGVWMIDKVTYTSDGQITLEMRDLARLLLDQVVFPPSVPAAEYPLSWSPQRSENVPGRDCKGGEWTDNLSRYGNASSSNDIYMGKGFTNNPFGEYVQAGGNVEGHRDKDAIVPHPREAEPDKYQDRLTYWMGTGQDSPHSFVWWQYNVKASRKKLNIAGVRLRMWGGPYRVYISVHNGKKWCGKKRIPYAPNGIAGTPGNVDIGANIPFMKSVVADRFVQFDAILPRRVRCRHLRITITQLKQRGVGEHPWAGGIREVKLYTAKKFKSLHFGKGHKLKVVGNYNDFTWIIKWTCAWAGWFWPPNSTGLDFIQRQGQLSGDPPYKEWVSYGYADNAMSGFGRVWGDFMRSGTKGVADLTVDMFDKKPMMDIINYVRDLLGYIFFIDEYGGVVWRQPNVWSLGNYRSYESLLRPERSRTSNIVTIRDTETLLDYSTTLDSSNIRERIFVANAVGGVGSVIKGFNPNPTGLVRTAGYCVDTETEIFTQRGWLKYDEVRPGDRTLSIDQENDRAVWQEIKDVAIFPAEKRAMSKLETSTASVVSTANHRWLVKNNGRWKWRTSETLVKNDRIPRSMKVDLPTNKVHSDELVQVVGWMMTEGTVKYDSGVISGMSISQSQVKNPGKCDIIRTALKSLFGDEGWSESSPRRVQGEIVWNIGAKNSRMLAEFMDTSFNTPLDDKKAVSMDFLSVLTQEQLDLFIRTCVLADGHSRMTGFNKTEASFFYQKPGARLDAFLAACALAGQPVSWHEDEIPYGDEMKARASVTLRKTATIAPFCAHGRYGVEPYEGEEVVWCPTMPEHHTWLARRNGSMYYTGNTDQNFKTKRETIVMADMISSRSMFTYRTSQVTIPGYPAIQIDDQVRIFERVTNETYYHYVMGIKSELDMDEGTWVYTLNTHWLGVNPADSWVVDVQQLDAVTRQYLNAVGYTAAGNEDGAWNA